MLAVWAGGALYTTSSPQARKGRNLDRDGRCTPYGAPTAGLPPYQPYEIRPATVLGFVNDPALGPGSTRWRF